MEKIKLYILTITIFSFLSACNDENENIKSITGVWNIYSVISQKPLDINNDGIFNTNILKEIEHCSDMSYEFEENGKITWIVIGTVFSTELGEPLNEPCEPIVHVGSWLLDEANSKLTIKWERIVTLDMDISDAEDTDYYIQLSGDKLTMLDSWIIYDKGEEIFCDAEFTRN